MIDWSNTALVFPGQGSQEVGMGADLADKYPVAGQVFEEADKILGFPLSRLCFEGPADQLDETINTQPALYVTGIATFRVLETLLGPIAPAAVAGHSLGELTALTAAGALPFESGLKLVRERGRLMKEAGQKNPGAMAALLGLEIADARIICDQASAEVGQPVVVANDNCPGQVVISGDEGALDRAMTLARERGVKRAVKLAVSIAAHSPLMAQAQESFRPALETTPFSAPRVPVVANITARPLHSLEDIREELSAQLTGSVLWTASVQAMRSLGVERFLELGPKDVLTGMLRRIDRAATGTPVNSAEAVATLVAS